MEDEHLIAELLEPLSRASHARRRHAEHRRPNQRPPLPALGHGRLGHSRNRAGRVREDALRDPVQAGDVHDRIGHRDVGRADVRARVARRERRDDQLRHAHREHPHGLRGDRGVAGAADREDPVEPAVGVEPGHDVRRPAPHRVDGGAAVARVPKRGHVGARRGCDLVLRHVGVGERLEDARVDQHDVDVQLLQPRPQVLELLALRVERAQEDNGCHARDPTAAVPVARLDSSRCPCSTSARSASHLLLPRLLRRGRS